jgi:hypothetical protein
MGGELEGDREKIGDAVSLLGVRAQKRDALY